MPISIDAPAPAVTLTMATHKRLPLVFFGTPLFSVPALRALHAAGWPIAAVITEPDRPVGRKMLMTPSPVKTAAMELSLPVQTPATLKDDAFFAEFSNLQPDLCVVVAYNKILPQRYLDIPRLGFLNIHPSLLPAYRGPSPLQTAILDGCAATGVSIMQLDADTDHGPLLAQESWTIPAGLDSPAAHDELFRVGADLLIRTLPGYLDGTVVPQPQDHSLATYTRKFVRADGQLNWTEPAVRINDRIRALSANPGTWTLWGDKTLNIFHSHVITETVAAHAPGTVFLHAGTMAIACGQGALAIESLQLEGSTRQNARDFLNGRAAIVGALLS